MFRSRFSLILAFLGAIFCVELRSAQAAPSVTAVLANSETRVGQMVQMEIRLTDAGNAVVPNQIPVEGLEIHKTGTSTQFEMHNFSTTSSVFYDYTILPLRAGTFKIPSQSIQVNGNTLRTPELTLRVIGAPTPQTAQGTPGVAGTPGASGTSTADTAPDKLAFAELVVPKKTAYVGEVIPVVARLHFATPARLTDPPEITAQGFTMQPLLKPEQQVETIDGRRWDLASFKTAIASTRPGKFEIGPFRANALVVVPRRPGTSRNGSAFEPFNLDDVFSDPSFRDAWGAFGRPENRTIVSEPVPLEIKPLPPGAPAGFSGAVGMFTITTEAKPKSVQVGDPITLTAKITGRGNFDRVTAPALEDEHGWHTYPPSAKFTQDDEVGISGEKTFEMVISPNEKKTAVPPLVFAYFDPAKEKYVILRSDATPIQVEGAPAVAAAGAPPQSAASSAAPAGAGQPTPKPADILYQLNERPSQPESFTPLYLRRDFRLAQLVPFIALLVLIGWKIRQARLHNREAQRIAGLQHEISEITRKLRRGSVSTTEYFPQASRLVQLKTALARNVDPNVVDLETAARVFDLDESVRDQLRQLFETSDELRYSGEGNGDDVVTAEQRREVLHLIENLRT